MNRLLIAVPFAVALLAGDVAAQVRLGSQGPYDVKTAKKEAPSKGAKPIRPEPTVYRFAITPAAEPELALKYSLLPEYEKIKPGNSVPFYYRSLLLLNDRKEFQGQEFWEKTWPRWTEGAIDQLPKDEIRKFLQPFRAVFAELKTATHRDQTDWSWRLSDVDGISAISFLMPEAQEARSFARLLNLKIRLELAEGRFDDAVESMQLGYKIARDIAEPPTLINDLIGVAIGSIMTGQLRDMINQPGSPNMYWALSSLPQPFIDMRPALQYEMQLPAKLFPALKDAETAERSPEEWSRLVADAFLKLQLAENGFSNETPQNRLQARLATTALVLQNYSRIKRELIAWGYDAKRVEQMPVGQAVIIHQSRTYRYMYQQILKWSYLPYHEAREGGLLTQERLKKDGYFGSYGRSREIIPLTGMLLPAVLQAQKASARMDAKIAALRVVEAVRMYAAANNGKLPSSLDKITAVPIPHNPLTGKPFLYWVKGDKAVLQIPPLGDYNLPPDWQRMEITVKKSR